MSLCSWVVLILFFIHILSVIRAVFFHPLSHIPGPKLWIAYPLLRHISAIRGTLDRDIRYWHEKYGGVVRFCPDAVSFITAEAWNVIYGHGHRQLPKVILSADTRKDIVTANDSDHTRYRKALSHAFSVKGLHAQEPIVSKHIDKLIERLKGFTESGLQVDMVKWYNLTTFDVIGDLAFGEPFGGLDSSEYHHWVTTVFSFVKVIPYLRAMDHYPLLFKVILAFLPRSFMEGRKRQIEHAKLTMQKRLNSPTAHGRGDFMDSMLRHRGDENELSVEELEANANFLIIAGSETTATLLSGVTYWLLQTPEALNKVTREVRSSFASEADITFSGVTVQLPYMQACLNEALRLYPPVPGGLERRTETPIQISGYKIPEQTKVSVHHSAAYWSPTNFHQPDRFIPERWLPEVKDDPASPFFLDDRDAFQPFSVGPRNCIGRNLAYTEMRMIIAKVFWSFDMELCEESRDWKDQKSFALWEKHPLICKLTFRRDK